MKKYTPTIRIHMNQTFLNAERELCEDKCAKKFQFNQCNWDTKWFLTLPEYDIKDVNSVPNTLGEFGLSPISI